MSREARQRSRWGCVVPGAVEAGLGHRALGVAERRRAGGRGTGGRCRPRSAPCAAGRRTPGSPPPATRTASATGQASHRGRAAVHTSAPSSISAIDQVAASASSVGQQALGEPLLGGRGGDRRQLDAADEAGQHPAHVGVEHRVPAAEAERRDRRGRVVADAGQRAQVVVRRRHPAAVPLDDRGGRGVQAQRAARVAEPAPRADGLAARRGGEVRGRRPGLQPLRGAPARPGRPASAGA